MSETATKGSTADKRRRDKRDEFWPDAASVIFNVEDRATTGYFRAPRVVPFVSHLIDQLGDRENAGPLYMELWAQDRGQSFIEVDPRATMYRAGYRHTLGRADRTWKERIRILEKLGFVRTRKNGLEDHGFVLLLDPHRAVIRLAAEGRVTGQSMDVFRSMCSHSGVDLTKYVPAVAAPAGTTEGGAT